MLKIENAKEAAATLAAMNPKKIEMVIAGLRRDHPHLRNAPDKVIREMLRSFVAANR